MNERRKPTDHEVVMAVINSMNTFGRLLYGALAFCLCAIMAAGILTGKWELAIVTSLISAVSAGAGAASGFMAGVLSQTFKAPITEPVPVTTPPGAPLETTEVPKEVEKEPSE